MSKSQWQLAPIRWNMPIAGIMVTIRPLFRDGLYIFTARNMQLGVDHDDADLNTLVRRVEEYLAKAKKQVHAGQDFQKLDETCSDCQQGCSSACKCWCHGS